MPAVTSEGCPVTVPSEATYFRALKVCWMVALLPVELNPPLRKP